MGLGSTATTGGSGLGSTATTGGSRAGLDGGWGGLRSGLDGAGAGQDVEAWGHVRVGALVGFDRGRAQHSRRAQ